MDSPSWWRHDDQRVAAVLQDAAVPAPQFAGNAATPAAAGEWWLRWSFVGRTEDAAQAGAELLQAAQQAGLEVRGQPWVRESPADGHAHGQIAVVEVAAPKR